MPNITYFDIETHLKINDHWSLCLPIVKVIVRGIKSIWYVLEVSIMTLFCSDIILSYILLYNIPIKYHQTFQAGDAIISLISGIFRIFFLKLTVFLCVFSFVITTPVTCNVYEVLWHDVLCQIKTGLAYVCLKTVP